MGYMASTQERFRTVTVKLRTFRDRDNDLWFEMRPGWSTCADSREGALKGYYPEGAAPLSGGLTELFDLHEVTD